MYFVLKSISPPNNYEGNFVSLFYSHRILMQENFIIAKDIENESRKPKTEVSEMWFYRRVLKIPRIWRRSKKEVLKDNDKRSERTIVFRMTKWELKFSGNIMMKKDSENLTLSEHIEGGTDS